MNERVTLWQVQSSTLTNMFGALRSGKKVSVPRDDEGVYFIDRDGASFRHVLNYLRAPAGAEPQVPEGALECAQLATDASFFQLPELVEACETKKTASNKAGGSPSQASTGIVRLDVGGVRYMTSVGTLCKLPPQGEFSILARMFGDLQAGGSAVVPRNSEGVYFIDRDGASFRHVLNYLRAPAGAEPQVPDSALERAQLATEADFYMLPELVEACSGPCKQEARRRVVESSGSIRSFVGLRMGACDLRGCDLRGLDLSRCDLRDANLVGANLSGSNLSGACLDGAKFQEVNYGVVTQATLGSWSPGRDEELQMGVVLTGATLRRCNLIGMQICLAQPSDILKQARVAKRKKARRTGEGKTKTPKKKAGGAQTPPRTPNRARASPQARDSALSPALGEADAPSELMDPLRPSLDLSKVAPGLDAYVEFSLAGTVFDGAQAEGMQIAHGSEHNAGDSNTSFDGVRGTAAFLALLSAGVGFVTYDRTRFELVPISKRLDWSLARVQV